MTIVPPYILLIEMPGGGELLIILVVVLLLFGGKKIPEMMRGLGRGMREFNDAKSNITRELEEGMKINDDSTDSNSNLKTTAQENTHDTAGKPPVNGNVSSHAKSPSNLTNLP